jgi:hypothetical protein
MTCGFCVRKDGQLLIQAKLIEELRTQPAVTGSMLGRQPVTESIVQHKRAFDVDPKIRLSFPPSGAVHDVTKDATGNLSIKTITLNDLSNSDKVVPIVRGVYEFPTWAR